MILDGTMTQKAAKVLARKAWEQYAGVPYTPDLDGPDVDEGDLAQAIHDGLKVRAAKGGPGGTAGSTPEDDANAVASGAAKLVSVPLN